MVAAAGAGDAGGTEVKRFFPIHRALAGLGFDHRDVVLAREGGQFRLGPGIDHAAPGDDQRFLRRLDRRHGLGQFTLVGFGAADVPDLGGEEFHRVIIGLGLGVLTEGKANRAAIGRIGHHPQGTGQRGQDMFGARDAVEIAHHRAEAVIRGNGGIVEILNLLQDRIGRAVGEHIAGDEENRQAVHMGQRGGGDHIGRARADGGGDRHRPAAFVGFGIGDGGMCHGLFVMAAPCGHYILDAMQRLAQTGHIAVTKDRPDAFDKPLALFGHLDGQPFHHGLRGSEPDCGHAVSPFAARAASQMPQRRAYLLAMSATA